MATATMKLPNGTVVTIEGSSEEVHRLLQLHAGSAGEKKQQRAGAGAVHERGEESNPPAKTTKDVVRITVNQVKSSPLAEVIETKILDQRSQMNRILLPLYVIHSEMNDEFGLTSGEISKVTRELGVPVGQPDVSKILAKEASRYVLGDSARVPGKPVRYKLSRRGVQLIAALLNAKQP